MAQSYSAGHKIEGVKSKYQSRLRTTHERIKEEQDSGWDSSSDDEGGDSPPAGSDHKVAEDSDSDAEDNFLKVGGFQMKPKAKMSFNSVNMKPLGRL
mmetsp:Transcript_18824/g.28962  ORF Transcript_18824/g.28962 Transcript_18824/m.28962 type:complete len:97 (+) Transcript_18824:102-392(+)|eukprot:CAMPEP_0170488260 /NCGR_PEP_ID=MMETSP0208-20121228/6854_1 /TAXON_ID=197538 /ORGANISM="Strombidium inclinatum, Strain S3" /LENGTH=96 /DNA_ID=CAMNT_0010762775 /DNA_START=51 /DNA_END=344 /DNA_ORIENTATION=-